MKWKSLGLVGLGFLLGTVGMRILMSKDAKKVYPHVVAAGLRGKDYVMKTATNVKEECSDILAEAKEINERRKQNEPEDIIPDANEGDCAEAAEETELIQTEEN
ncbi:MAG: hypothetical protein IKI20_07730 [Lachnospiraceae bacterium]|nr:hypothetical protein [Lachnospiraceae bacterium]